MSNKNFLCVFGPACVTYILERLEQQCFICPYYLSAFEEEDRQPILINAECVEKHERRSRARARDGLFSPLAAFSEHKTPAHHTAHTLAEYGNMTVYSFGGGECTTIKSC